MILPIVDNDNSNREVLIKKLVEDVNRFVSYTDEENYKEKLFDVLQSTMNLLFFDGADDYECKHYLKLKRNGVKMKGCKSIIDL